MVKSHVEYNNKKQEVNRRCRRKVYKEHRRDIYLQEKIPTTLFDPSWCAMTRRATSRLITGIECALQPRQVLFMTYIKAPS